MLAHYRLQLGPFHFHANRLTPKDKEHLVAKGAVKDEKTLFRVRTAHVYHRT